MRPSVVLCSLLLAPAASSFRMGPTRSVRSLASFLSPDLSAGRVVYLCHSSTQIRLSYLFSPCGFLAMPFQGCNGPSARQPRSRYLHGSGKFPLELRSRNKGKCATDSFRCVCAPESFPNSFLSPVLLSSLCLLDFLLLLPSLQRKRYGPRPPRTSSTTLRKFLKGWYRQFDNPWQCRGLL